MTAKTETPDMADFDAFDDDDVFDAPPESSFFVLADNLGRLVLVEPLKVETGVKTSSGDTDAIRANVHVLDGDDAPTSYEDTLVFGKVLVGTLKKKLGKRVLGRVAQGDKKPGQSAPWVLKDATQTPEDVAVAKAFRKAQRESQDPFNG